ncbi:HNH endonuclease family protein [Microbacterium sp.]|uniref:HNH endonuclease family protein n=1 Tax=Microbacterium sp. TaxID=51671 RepID=UPI001AC12938|nr:HNH endonuclease family protein [Microbacterium sp.]MBN9192898.1 HNH endonuclease [Microbacterium sp.]
MRPIAAVMGLTGKGARRAMAAIAVAMTVAVLATGCVMLPGRVADPTAPPRATDGASARPGGLSAPGPAAVAAAKRDLAGLAVDRGGASAAYDRAAFGEPWADVDGNGCDTRNDVLRRDLRGVAVRAGTCRVSRGVLIDPYDGERVAFVSGAATSELVQIDHVVSLSYAWRHGAEAWTAARRLAFANDPRDLVAVSERMNDVKGPFGPGQWLPPSATGRCVFVVRWVAVMAEYGLTVHPGDRAAVERVLPTC